MAEQTSGWRKVFCLQVLLYGAAEMSREMGKKENPACSFGDHASQLCNRSGVQSKFFTSASWLCSWISRSLSGAAGEPRNPAARHSCGVSGWHALGCISLWWLVPWEEESLPLVVALPAQVAESWLGHLKVLGSASADDPRRGRCSYIWCMLLVFSFFPFSSLLFYIYGNISGFIHKTVLTES